jgi:hypothetical protein
MCGSPDIKPNSLRAAERVLRIGNMTDAYRILVESAEGRGLLFFLWWGGPAADATDAPQP